MADIKTAAQWLKEGKRVRLKTWDDESYIYVKDSGNNLIYDQGNHINHICNDYLLSNEWELYSEPTETLYNKKKNMLTANDTLVYRQEEVKEAIQKVLKELHIRSDDWDTVRDIFGEELING